jgi:hypothetical protein
MTFKLHNSKIASNVPQALSSSPLTAGVPTKLAISVTVNTVNPPVTVNISGLKN